MIYKFKFAATIMSFKNLPCLALLILATAITGCVKMGCTEFAARNYSRNAVINNGSCKIYGCTDSTSISYNPNANTSNDSCTYVPQVIFWSSLYGYTNGTIYDSTGATQLKTFYLDEPNYIPLCGEPGIGIPLPAGTYKYSASYVGGNKQWNGAFIITSGCTFQELD